MKYSFDVMKRCLSLWAGAWVALWAVGGGLAPAARGQGQAAPVFPGTEPDAVEEKPAAGVGEIIPVTDMDTLRARLGQTVRVRGEVSGITTGPSGYKRITFKDTKFFLYLAKRELDRFPEWNLEGWQGRTLFAAGVVAEHRGQLELLIKSPAQLAEAADKLSLAPAVPSPTRGTAATPGGGAGSSTAPQRTTATLSQFVARLNVPQPYLAFERFSATLAPGYRSTAPITLESYNGRDRAPAMAGVEAVRALRGWPANHVLRVTRALTDGAPGPGLPHSLAVALLVEAMMEDFALPETLAVGGRVKPDGTLAGGREELMLLPTPLPPEGSVLLVPAAAAATLTDLALDGQWEALTRHSILGAKTFADVSRLARALGAGELAGAVEAFAALQPDLQRNPASAIASAGVRAKLGAVVSACPEHLTARVLLEWGTARQEPRYSPAASALKLRLFYAKLADTRLSKAKNKEDETKKKLRELKGECRELRAKIDPSGEAFHTSLKEWIDAMEDNVKFPTSDDSNRAKKARRELGLRAEESRKAAEEAAKGGE